MGSQVNGKEKEREREREREVRSLDE